MKGGEEIACAIMVDEGTPIVGMVSSGRCESVRIITQPCRTGDSIVPTVSRVSTAASVSTILCHPVLDEVSTSLNLAMLVADEQ